MAADYTPSTNPLPDGYVNILDWLLNRELAAYRQYEDRELSQILGMVTLQVSDG